MQISLHFVIINVRDLSTNRISELPAELFDNLNFLSFV